jgi:Ca-activated chloride channel family protein
VVSWLGSGSLTAWHLAEPFALIALGLALLPWLASWKRPRLGWSTLEGFRGVWTVKARVLRHLPSLLLSLAIVCLSVALARPRTIGGQSRIAAKGVAIVVAIDRSASMMTEDFSQPGAKVPLSRLEAAKKTLAAFVEGRPDDLIGVIAFADVPRGTSPPTLDHGFVLDAVRGIRPANTSEGGTNLGRAIALGLDELRGQSTPKKVLILLTDGRDSPAVSDTIAPIAPEEAASLAKPLGITIHTIAVGGPGKKVAIEDFSKRPVASEGPDLARLETLAKLGGGKAFAADDTAALEAVFKEIDALERSPVAGTVRTRYREGYPYFVIGAMICILAERLLRMGPLRVLP